MRCALELVMTATIKAEEKAAFKALREQEERERKRANTIRYCEKLGERLEKKADKGELPQTSFYCDKWDKRPLVSTYSDYADKRLSYREDGDELDLELLKEWFAQYCFDVAVNEYGYYRYGCGYCKGYEIVISPAMECVK